MPNKYASMVGLTVGNWQILKYEGYVQSRKCSTFYCRCTCGAECSVRCYNIATGRSKSCMQCARHTSKPNRYKGTGEGNTRLHRCWDSMKSRCNTPTNYHYKWYGARGIKVCKEWNDSFQNFKAWALENGYQEDLLLDRIDNDGDYTPENCRWATMAEQCRNRRTNVNLTYNGKTMCLCDWSKETGIAESTISNRINHGWSIEKALTTPVRKQRGYGEGLRYDEGKEMRMWITRS